MKSYVVHRGALPGTARALLRMLALALDAYPQLPVHLAYGAAGRYPRSQTMLPERAWKRSRFCVRIHD